MFCSIKKKKKTTKLYLRNILHNIIIYGFWQFNFKYILSKMNCFQDVLKLLSDSYNYKS